MGYSDAAIGELAKSIYRWMYKPMLSDVTTIFLCGGRLDDKRNLRSKLAAKMHSVRGYSILYPEELFDVLLYGKNQQDLLSLEEILADAVDVIILVPESPGSYTELGAFVSNERLRCKTICIINSRYKSSRSFINKGPVKLIAKTKQGRIVYYDDDMIEAAISKIQKVIGRIAKKQELGATDSVPFLRLAEYLLPAIYLLEPVSKEILTRLAAKILVPRQWSDGMIDVALNMMHKRKEIERTENYYALTRLGASKYYDEIGRMRKYRRMEMIDRVDALRLEILNVHYRDVEYRDMG